MKVIILCGGHGTRLREHTETLPKPMVEVGGRPILWHIMKVYAHYGFTDFVLCLGYMGDKIKEYFLNYEAMNTDFTVELGKKDGIELHDATHQEDGWKVTLAETGQNAMTGARVKRASRYLAPGDETFCVTYGDGVANVDLKKAYAFHKSHGGLATVTGVRPPSRYGELELEGTKVVSFSEKPQVSQGLINGGYFFFQREFLDLVSADASQILEREPLEQVAREGQLHVFEHDGYWQCMDTFREWQVLERHWKEGTAPWAVWKR